MHIRFSSCIGIPVCEEGDQYPLGTISGILIHPDTGKVEGFVVWAQGVELFCGSADILRWGTRIYVRSADALAPPEDRIRLQSLLADPRTVLGQKIRTESGASIGRCKDVQLNTDTMHIEWLFPKSMFRWGVALPISEVLEVRRDAIIIRDPIKKAKVPSAPSIEPSPIPDIEPGMT